MPAASKVEVEAVKPAESLKNPVLKKQISLFDDDAKDAGDGDIFSVSGTPDPSSTQSETKPEVKLLIIFLTGLPNNCLHGFELDCLGICQILGTFHLKYHVMQNCSLASYHDHILCNNM